MTTTTENTTEKEKNPIELHEEREKNTREKTKKILKLLEGCEIKEVQKIFETINSYFVIPTLKN